MDLGSLTPFVSPLSQCLPPTRRCAAPRGGPSWAPSARAAPGASSGTNGNAGSQRPPTPRRNRPADPLERQFERFNQANTILKSRDLGSIICDIKFSELTYLDAFWRDYINGSLLEALKGVFITDSLKQAVGHEAIKLLVNVDEEDYELGRQKLLRNLMLHTAP
uniref:TRADD-like N-terminal domain-containing protein n=1 Tax=Ficedula albicollis TaxID=59894 RepID=U3KG36_FICAL